MNDILMTSLPIEHDLSETKRTIFFDLFLAGIVQPHATPKNGTIAYFYYVTRVIKIFILGQKTDGESNRKRNCLHGYGQL